MARKPAGLGRGLAELLGEKSDQSTRETGEYGAEGLSGDGPVVSSGGVVEIEVAAVRPNPRQPRRSMNAESLGELARSIEATGMVQPVIVRPVEGAREDDKTYELIAGERRWRAAQMAGHTIIPAILREASDSESLEIALVENVVRKQLNPVDEAYAFRVLLEDLEVTQGALAERVGKSRSSITNKIRLLELPDEVQELLVEEGVTEGHARALLGLESRGDLVRLSRRTAKEGLSVRAVEEEVRRLNEKGAAPSVSSSKNKEQALPKETVDRVKEHIYGLLDVVPRVKAKGKGGVIEIPFQDEGDLERILGGDTPEDQRGHSG